MFAAIGRVSIRHRWLVIAFWVLLLGVSLPLVPGVARALQAGGFTSEELESQQALALIGRKLGVRFTNVQIFFSSDRLTVDDPPFAAQASAAIQGLQDWDLVGQIVSFERNPEQISADRRASYATVVFQPAAESVRNVPDQLRARLVPQPDLTVSVGGGPVFYQDILRVSEEDLRRAELIAVPFAAIALLLVFRSPVAAALPALVGGAAAVIALAGIALIARVTPLSIFVLNTATLFGLGLGVDYSLFLVSRFREELNRGRSVEDAVVASVATAGRAVFFSGLTVSIGLGALLLFRFNMLRSVGIGGVLVVVFAVGAALTLLPAVLSLLGRRIDAFSIRANWRNSRGEGATRTASQPVEGGFWHRLAMIVMARPVTVLLLVGVALLVLGAPFLEVRLGAPDASILPKNVPSRVAFDLLQTRFRESTTTPVILAVTARKGSTFDQSNLDALDRYVRRIQADERVERVDSIVSLDPRFTLDQYKLLYSDPRRIGDAFVQTAVASLVKDDLTLIRVTSKFSMLDSRSTDLVGALRNSRPAEFEVLVSGGSASVVDYVNTLYHDFPIAVLTIMVVTYVVLLLLFRSVVLPLKAIVMNCLSIFASYGALVYVFQQGHFSGLLGFEPLGFVEASIPVIMFCAVFGLSMDYEVFLLSRVQEHYILSGDNRLSVAVGLERSGRIVTSAALIVVAVSLSFLTADMILVKALGLGTALAVALDATLVRGLLVPATMRLLGDLNWWLPAWLDRLLPRIEHGDLALQAPSPATGGELGLPLPAAER